MAMGDNIWIVDDDHSIRWVLEKALNQAEIETRSFESGDAMLNQLGSTRPDAIISDIRMPGTNGLDVLKKVHEKYPRLPIIIMTGRRGYFS